MTGLATVPHLCLVLKYDDLLALGTTKDVHDAAGTSDVRMTNGDVFTSVVHEHIA